MKNNSQNIIFLDIDGPMIPSSCWLLFEGNPSFERNFSPISVAIINAIGEKGVKIVFNSTHNKMFPTRGREEETDIKQVAIRNGIKEDYIHSDYKTTYPEVKRFFAIQRWLNEHPEIKETNWLAFDDENFNHPNLILIDFDIGLNLKHYNIVMKRFFNKIGLMIL